MTNWVLVSLFLYTLRMSSDIRERVAMNIACLVVMLSLGADPVVPVSTTKLDPPEVIDYVSLINRKPQVSSRYYPQGATVRGLWKWKKGGGKYPDHLCVTFFTDGRQRKWPQEVDSGLVVRFTADSVSIATHHPTGDKPLKTVGNLSFKKGTSYDIEVDCTLERVTVTVDGKEIAAADVPKDFRRVGGKIFFYNREKVGGTDHVSGIWNVRMEPKG